MVAVHIRPSIGWKQQSVCRKLSVPAIRALITWTPLDKQIELPGRNPIDAPSGDFKRQCSENNRSRLQEPWQIHLVVKLESCYLWGDYSIQKSTLSADLISTELQLELEEELEKAIADSSLD